MECASINFSFINVFVTRVGLDHHVTSISTNVLYHHVKMVDNVSMVSTISPAIVKLDILARDANTRLTIVRLIHARTEPLARTKSKDLFVNADQDLLAFNVRLQ